jgi:hypothetical protein
LAKHHPKKKETPDTPDLPDFGKKDPPSSEPMINEHEKHYNESQLNKLFWLRIALAVIAGISATFLFEQFEGEERRWVSIGFMITIFIVTIFIAKEMKMKLPKSDRKKIVTQAIGSYIFIYLFMWILSYTIVNVNESGTGLVTPFT